MATPGAVNRHHVMWMNLNISNGHFECRFIEVMIMKTGIQVIVGVAEQIKTPSRIVCPACLNTFVSSSSSIVKDELSNIRELDKLG